MRPSDGLKTMEPIAFDHLLPYFIAALPYRGLQRSEGLLLLHICSDFKKLKLSPPEMAYSILQLV